MPATPPLVVGDQLAERVRPEPLPHEEGRGILGKRFRHPVLRRERSRGNGPVVGELVTHEPVQAESIRRIDPGQHDVVLAGHGDFLAIDNYEADLRKGITLAEPTVQKSRAGGGGLQYGTRLGLRGRPAEDTESVFAPPGESRRGEERDVQLRDPHVEPVHAPGHARCAAAHHRPPVGEADLKRADHLAVERSQHRVPHVLHAELDRRGGDPAHGPVHVEDAAVGEADRDRLARRQVQLDLDEVPRRREV
jgi:hypothetical protein